MRRSLAYLWLVAAVLVGPALAQELSGPPGTYAVTAPRPVRITHPTPTSVLLDWSGTDPIPPGPGPGPGPGPSPDPPPVPPPVPPSPSVKAAWVTLIYDPATDTAQTGAIKDDPAFLDALSKLGIDNTHYVRKPISDPYVTAKNLTATAQKTGVPCLILQDEAGKPITAVKATNTADALKLIGGHR